MLCQQCTVCGLYAPAPPEWPREPPGGGPGQHLRRGRRRGPRPGLPRREGQDARLPPRGRRLSDLQVGRAATRRSVFLTPTFSYHQKGAGRGFGLGRPPRRPPPGPFQLGRPFAAGAALSRTDDSAGGGGGGDGFVGRRGGGWAGRDHRRNGAAADVVGQGGRVGGGVQEKSGGEGHLVFEKI